MPFYTPKEQVTSAERATAMANTRTAFLADVLQRLIDGRVTAPAAAHLLSRVDVPSGDALGYWCPETKKRVCCGDSSRQFVMEWER
jgi:hypothetical protein